MDNTHRPASNTPDAATIADEHFAQRRFSDALHHYLIAVQADPANAALHYNLAIAALRSRRFGYVEQHLREVVRLKPNDPRGYQALGRYLFDNNRLGEAVEYVDAALKLAPADVKLVTARGYLYEVFGEFRAVLELVRPLIAAGVKDLDIGILMSRVASTTKCEREAIDYITSVLRLPGLTPTQSAGLHFSLAKVLDQVGEYDRAFEAAARAHGLGRRPYDPNATTAYVDRRIHYFQPPKLRELPRASRRSRRPIFIVGMPRSGTSLVEQILASHPQVFGAGELSALTNAITAHTAREWTGGRPYPECLDGLTADVADRMAGDYLAAIDAMDRGATYVTDKMHLNFAHVGMIDLLFPDCHVIHCTRDTLDTCLSCYMSFLQGSDHAHDLQHLGLYYRDYERLMRHWTSVLNVPILDVKYEHIVRDTEGQTRRLLDWLDLPWDDRCLRYYENRRAVATLSAEQVRKPIYTSAIGRWKHYERHLRPLIAALGDTAQEPPSR